MKGRDWGIRNSPLAIRTYLLAVGCELLAGSWQLKTDTAVNRGHVRVQESDLQEAEKQYSQYALDSILVEDEPMLQAILYEFVGASPNYKQQEIYTLLSRAGVAEEDMDGILDRLCALTFLGVEANDGDFRFATDPQEHRRNLVLARRLAETRDGQLRFTVNRPFWAFLEIRDN